MEGDRGSSENPDSTSDFYKKLQEDAERELADAKERMKQEIQDTLDSGEFPLIPLSTQSFTEEEFGQLVRDLEANPKKYQLPPGGFFVEDASTLQDQRLWTEVIFVQDGRRTEVLGDPIRLRDEIPLVEHPQKIIKLRIKGDNRETLRTEWRVCTQNEQGHWYLWPYRGKIFSKEALAPTTLTPIPLENQETLTYLQDYQEIDPNLEKDLTPEAIQKKIRRKFGDNDDICLVKSKQGFFVRTNEKGVSGNYEWWDARLSDFAG